ncbi:MAG: VOC family protein [Acidimicrobiia bacterium]|nr:VOC family protein [Acidimicrobiia bacterium]NNF11553.1 VOC family protein [Acidimicrobiia bacterium]NNL68870.1 VOC family protein [Acidimicrobiia bacterium]
MLHDVKLEASLPASDLARARNWYHEKLDLKPVEEDDNGNMWFETGGVRWFLYESQFAGTNQATYAGFMVSDVEGTADELRSRGVVFEEYDMGDFKTENGILALPDGGKGAWFKDSEGNILSLFQRG